MEDKIDLLFVDEFYKLDPDRDDGRYETLNLALYRHLPTARQWFMAGPHIRAIDLGPSYAGNFRLLRTDYKTVTVNILDRSAVGSRLECFLKDISDVGDDSSLVFTSTPAVAHEVVTELLKADVGSTSDVGTMFQQWIAENYHPDWIAMQGLSQGVAVHHGRLPRALAQLFVQLFDQKHIRILVCTSTLIEGVNTSAANVFIFDKKISRTDFDFFSFANIKGRVGRMMRHFVGNAYLYHQAPAEVETDVDVPIFSNPSGGSDFIIMNVDRESLSPEGRNRVDRLPEDTGIPTEIIKEHGSIGVDLLVRVQARAKEMLAEDTTLLVWSGYPNWDQKVALAELVLIVSHQKKEPTGLHAPKQVAWAWSQLSQATTISAFLRWYTKTFSSGPANIALDGAFQFLQACEFGFPRTLAAIQSLVSHRDVKGAVHYGKFISGMEQWFKPAWMKQLDESGIPLPLGERLAPMLNQPNTRLEAIARIKGLRISDLARLSPMDRLIIQMAFSGDARDQV